ncbi:B12-binding domain-containing radical SAM protein [Kitasatospora sp. NPDC057692]|uniref:B12-binding domain-containing radical SAM protein n=1 Tax=Kitasatospora sp. NPDC057692 TaxID=3346215 RepID=UPI00368CD9DD
MRWSLVFPPFEDKRDRSAYYVAPPLGLLSIAAYLEADGHDVAIEDFVLRLKTGELRAGPRMYDECAERILASEPDVVGFGTQCSTGPASLNIARRIKAARPGTAVVLGGHDVSFLGPRYLEAFPYVDAVLGGEAELTVPKLARALDGSGPWEGIAGLTWRRRGTIAARAGEERVTDLDSLLAPSYHLVDDLGTYFEHSRKPTILVDSGRGCAFACEFCQTTLLNGRKVRYRSTASLIAELSEHRARYGEFEAYFVHDLFTARRAFVEELSHALIDADLDLPWQCRCRIDEVDRELLALMSAAGCRMLLYGVESGSDETLSRMNKRLRRGVASQTTERVRWTVDSGIFPSLSMVVGIPEEKPQDLDATLRLAAEFIQVGRVNAFIQLMSPLPGTALAQRVAHRLEYRAEDAPTAFSQGIEFADGRRLPEDEELIAALPDIFQSFHVVTPDHGDLDICVDISLGYCKLLEVYGWTYIALAEHLDVSLLELFRRYRDRAAEQRGPGGRRGLVGLKDHEIWDAFARFTAGVLASGDAPVLLRETFRFESLVQEISVLAPVPDDGPKEAPAGRFRLRRAARLFRSSIGLPWADPDTEGPRDHLVFMGPDRLKVVAVDSGRARALEILERAGGLEEADEALFANLAALLRPVAELGVFEPVPVPAGVAG